MESNLISLVSLGISIRTLFQNRKLHDENQRLQIIPNLSVELLFNPKIEAWFEKISNGFDEFNIQKTKYHPYYTNHDIIINNANEILFTLYMINNGRGPANDITINSIKFKTNACNIDTCDKGFSSNEIIFSLDEKDKKASKIYSRLKQEDIKEVHLHISYKDIQHKKYNEIFVFAPIDNECAEMKIVKHDWGQNNEV